MPKKALIILADGFEDIEAVTPIDVLRRAGVHVVVAGLKDIKIRGSRGVVMLADKKLADAGPDFDICVIPGGMEGASNIAASKEAGAAIKDIFEKEGVVAAICAAPAVVLAPLGILKNRSATCYPGMEGHFGKDVKFKDDRVVVDGNLITSRGPGTALEFSLAIVEKLVGRAKRDEIAKAVLM